jgi:hypothetical protein
MERIEMSQEERDKLEWLKRAKDGVIRQREAAGKMGVSDRWVRKLLKRMKREGDHVVVHGLGGAGLEPQDRRESASPGDGDSKAARLARFWADLSQPNSWPSGLRSRSAKRTCVGG